jgi:phosphotransferase system  glucose/maltose/N-acetylglucosamine-specific IIC component
MKTEIKWGLIFSLVQLLWLSLEYAVGLHDRYISLHLFLSLLFIIPAFVMMILAIAEKRRSLGGSIGFKQAFLCGLGVSVVVSLLAPLNQFIFHRFINPSFFENMIDYMTSTGRSTLEQANAVFNLKSYMLQASMGAIVAGVITSLILAAIMRDRKGKLK